MEENMEQQQQKQIQFQSAHTNFSSTVDSVLLMMVIT